MPKRDELADLQSIRECENILRARKRKKYLNSPKYRQTCGIYEKEVITFDERGLQP